MGIMCAPSEVMLTRHVIIDKYAKGMIHEGLMHYQYDIYHDNYGDKFECFSSQLRTVYNSAYRSSQAPDPV